MACTGTPVHDNPVFICESWSLCNLPKWNKNQLHSSNLSYLWWLHTSVIRDADKIWGNYAEAKIILEWPVFIYCKLPVCIPVHVYFSRNNTINCFCKFKCLVSARQRNSLFTGLQWIHTWRTMFQPSAEIWVCCDITRNPAGKQTSGRMKLHVFSLFRAKIVKQL